VAPARFGFRLVEGKDVTRRLQDAVDFCRKSGMVLVYNGIVLLMGPLVVLLALAVFALEALEENPCDIL